ncbi:MAG: DUF1566 domain-containing protein [Candidatus Rokubacteria bacterium]|nr:DUF1566 domain-containing protein [Candidatus Rokubacteria bacterium]
MNFSSGIICRYGCGPDAVLDNETGLVWDRSTALAGLGAGGNFDWNSAHVHCNTLKNGSRTGWRLPTLQELGSLVDLSESNPSLPSGHPFFNVGGFSYWSATSSSYSPNLAWFVSFFDGSQKVDFKYVEHGAWCVRSGQGVDPQ